MKLLTVLLAASFVFALPVASESHASQATGPAREDASALVPSGFRVDEFVVSRDGKRTYFTNLAGELFLYVTADKTTSRLAAGPAWDLDVSQSGNVLAYTKAGTERGERHVWALSLDPATGLARGTERQVSMDSGDVPSISPDGKSVAFARDDPSGVGQTLVLAPIGGRNERVITAPQLSSLAWIRWTPDGKTVFFGVNPPVACVPGWSCLPLAPELRDSPGVVARVAAKGGAAVAIPQAHSAGPGLSPDGHTLLYLESVGSTTRRWIIADADGTRRDTLTLRPMETPVRWLRSSIVLITMAAGARGRTDAPDSPTIVCIDLSSSRSQQR